MTSSMVCWNCSSTTSIAFCMPRGTSSSRRVAMNAIPARMIITSHV